MKYSRKIRRFLGFFVFIGITSAFLFPYLALGQTTAAEETVEAEPVMETSELENVTEESAEPAEVSSDTTATADTTAAIIAGSGPVLQAEGRLDSTMTWPAGARVIVQGEVTVPRRDSLIIEPGVIVELGAGGTLTLEGILLAEGTEEAPIQFIRADDSQPWGRILFLGNSRAQYDENGDYTGGSKLVHAIIEGGGFYSSGFGDGVVTVSGGSPFLSHLLIRNNETQNGGGIALVNGACSHVEHCTITGNTTRGNGGGIYISLNADATIEDNTILRNTAGRDGGGVFISFSPAVISRNIIEDNSAARDGGALALNGSTPTVRLNVFRNNHAGNEGPNIVLRSGEPVITLNSFICSELETGITTQPSTGAAQTDLNAGRNYWGTTERILLDRRRVDRIQDPTRPLVMMNPVLEGPPDSVSLRPCGLESFRIFEDEAYSVELPTDYIGFQSYLYLEMQGCGEHPLVEDWALLDFVTGRSDSLRVILHETEEESGVFRGTVFTDSRRSPDDNRLATRVGARVRLTPVGFRDLALAYPVDVQQPFVRNMVMRNIPDLTHVTNDLPCIDWNYVEPRQREQRKLKMTVFSEDSSVYWESGEIDSGRPTFQYAGPEFTRGENFIVQIEVINDRAWSDPVQIPFRRNSVPSAPEITYPFENEVLLTQTPSIQLQTDLDREGDAMWAEFDIAYENNPAVNVQQSAPNWVVGSGEVVHAVVETPEPEEELVEVTEPEPEVVEESAEETVEDMDEAPTDAEGESEEIADEEVVAEASEETPEVEEVQEEENLVDVLQPVVPAPVMTPGRGNTTWNMSEPLEDNQIYQVRARITDSLEVTEDSPWLRFIVNLFNDTPGEYAITMPQAYDERLPGDLITWSEPYDPDPEDTLTYTIRYGSATGVTLDREFTVRDLTGIEGLIDDAEYPLTVEVRDRFDALVIAADSARPVYYNAVNDTPTVPMGFTLSDSQRVMQYPAPLAWTTSTDEDHSDPIETLYYEIDLKREDGTPVAILRTEPGVVQMDLTPIEDNSRAVWMVRALDNENTPSAWSAPGILEVNIEDEPPLPFALQDPVNNAVPYSLGPTTFRWAFAQDVDPLNTVSYTFYLSTSREFEESEMVFEQDLDGNTTAFETDLEHLVDYYWRVKATDNTGLSTMSETYHFHVNSTPTAPQWTAALPFEVEPAFNVQWNASTDPDPRDVIEYAVEISADGRFTEGTTAIADPVNSTSIRVNNIPGIDDVIEDDGRMYVRIKARDDQGFEGDWGAVAETWMNFYNNVPEPPELTSPRDVELTDTRPTFQWNPAFDHDHTDSTETLRYIVRVTEPDSPETPVVNGIDTLEAIVSWRPDNLPDNAFLQWQVRTIDDDGEVSEWSDPVSFSIDRRPEAPERFDLVSPVDRGTADPNRPITFEWNEAVDVDLNSVVTYTLEIRGDAELLFDGIEDLEYTLSEGLPTGNYRWRIIALDEEGLDRASGNFRLTVGQP